MTKTRKEWSTADSEKEMRKWIANSNSNNPAVDPVVRQTVENLAENMWFFLETISSRVGRYQEAWDEVKAVNPNVKLGGEGEDQQISRGLRLPNEDAFTTLHIRRYITTEEEEEEAAKETASPTTTTAAATSSSPAVAEPATPATTTEENKKEEQTAEAEAEEEESDDDDDDAYDCVEAIPIDFPDNKALILRMTHLKQAGTELLTVFNGIADWISLSIPDVKMDDNDSVDVMNTVLETTNSYIEAIETTKTFHREYLNDRADNEVAVLKFPHSASLRRVMLATDLDCWNEVERGWQTLTRCSLILHTLLSNNMKKLADPRGSQSAAGIYQ